MPTEDLKTAEQVFENLTNHKQSSISSTRAPNTALFELKDTGLATPSYNSVRQFINSIIDSELSLEGLTISNLFLIQQNPKKRLKCNALEFAKVCRRHGNLGVYFDTRQSITIL